MQMNPDYGSQLTPMLFNFIQPSHHRRAKNMPTIAPRFDENDEVERVLTMSRSTVVTSSKAVSAAKQLTALWPSRHKRNLSTFSFGDPVLTPMSPVNMATVRCFSTVLDH